MAFIGMRKFIERTEKYPKSRAKPTGIPEVFSQNPTSFSPCSFLSQKGVSMPPSMLSKPTQAKSPDFAVPKRMGLEPQQKLNSR